LAKRLSERQKEEICKLFTSGISIDELSNQYNCTKLTISRNLKKKFDEDQYNLLLSKSKSIKNKNKTNDYKIEKQNRNNIYKINNDEDKKEENFSGHLLPISEFIEITPLNYDIENTSQKDLSSVSIAEANLPKTVYMIVNKKVELEIKYLKDYPEWQFLSQDELERKTIEIYFDLKIAKTFCQKDQKVIKVPNTKVFKKVASILSSRGISRIVSSDQLIAL
tara:strand:- start:140 stop:805 length:666 start_codon:yes stop_codon:yes gene_type:complete